MSLTLLKELALTDFKLRYKNSVLGYLWSLLKPLGIFGSLYIVYSLVIRFDQAHYPLFLLLGILLWNYFTEATINGMHALVSKASLLTKLNVDKKTIVLASNLSTVLTLILNLAVFFGFLAVLKPEIGFSMSFVILTIGNLFLISLGFSLVLAGVFVRFRDLSSIWDILLQMGFWLTPIIYPITLVPEKYANIMRFNPMHRVIDEARQTLISLQFPNFSEAIVTLSISMLIFCVGYLVFLRSSRSLNESL